LIYIFDQVEPRILSGGAALSSAAFGKFVLAFNKRPMHANHAALAS